MYGKQVLEKVKNLPNNTNQVISELEGKINGISMEAVSVVYDNTESGLEGSNVQTAIDEIVDCALKGKDSLVTAIGSPVVDADSLDRIAGKVDVITNKLRTTLSDKGVGVTGSDKLNSLVDKVGGMEAEFENYYYVAGTSGYGIMEYDITTGATISTTVPDDSKGFGPRCLCLITDPYSGFGYMVAEHTSRIYTFDMMSKTPHRLGNQSCNYHAALSCDVNRISVSYVSHNSSKSTFLTYSYPFGVIGGTVEQLPTQEMFGAWQGIYDFSDNTYNIIGVRYVSESSSEFSFIDPVSGAVIDSLITINEPYNVLHFKMFYDFEQKKNRLFYYANKTGGTPTIIEYDIYNNAIIDNSFFVGNSSTKYDVVCVNKLKR